MLPADVATLPARSPARRGPHDHTRRRLVWGIGLIVVVAVAGTSVVNWTRFALRCDGGSLHAYRGLPLPFGERALSIARYPTIAVPESQCRDRVVGSAAALEKLYVDAAVRRIDAAIEADDQAELEKVAVTVDKLVGEDVRDGGPLARRKQGLLVALIRADLRLAQGATGRIQARLDAAEDSGVPEPLLEAIRGEVRELADVLSHTTRPRTPVPSLPAGPPDPAGGRAL